MFLPDYVLGFSFVCLFFMIIWTVMYPELLWEDMTFRSDESTKHKVFMFVVLWAFLVSAVNALTYLVEVFV